MCPEMPVDPLPDGKPMSEAKVTVGGRLLHTGEAFITADRSGGWFAPTDDSAGEIPRNGATLTMWGNHDPIPMLNVVRSDSDDGVKYRFAMIAEKP
jgi:hypothetical protein